LAAHEEAHKAVHEGVPMVMLTVMMAPHVRTFVVALVVAVTASLVARTDLLELVALLLELLEWLRALVMAIMVVMCALAMAVKRFLHPGRPLLALRHRALCVTFVIVMALHVASLDRLEHLALLLHFEPRLWALLMAIHIITACLVALPHLHPLLLVIPVMVMVMVLVMTPTVFCWRIRAILHKPFPRSGYKLLNGCEEAILLKDTCWFCMSSSCNDQQ